MESPLCDYFRKPLHMNHSIYGNSVKVNIMIRDKLFMNDTSPAPHIRFCHMLYCNHLKKGTTVYGIFHKSGAAALWQ